MTCIDAVTYAKAVSDCNALKNASSSIKGLGSPNYILRGQIRGVGDAVPTATLNTSYAQTASSYDPCAIAAGTPCPQGGNGDIVCPTGTFKSCLLTAPGKPLNCSCLNVSTTTTKALIPAATTTSTAGFSQWGLIAAVAAAGVGYAVYAHSKKKKAS